MIFLRPNRLGVLSVFLGITELARAASAVNHAATTTFTDQLSKLRTQVVSLESELITNLKSKKQAQTSVKKIQLLLKLQQTERSIGKKRLGELESRVMELEARRATLADRIRLQQLSVRRELIAVERSQSTVVRATQDAKSSHSLHKSELLEGPRRKVLANLVQHSIKEMEVLKVDLADAEQLQSRIDEEKQQLAYLFQDLREQDSILELNRQLQLDMIQRKHEERLSQLENYRKLKSSEHQVEQLLSQFNARLELQKATDTERAASRAMSQGAFGKLKGRLALPIPKSRILSAFGRVYDSKSKLHIFKKGIDIEAGKKTPVFAVSAGRLAFSGELPEYGRVAIVDHGDHFYTLYAHLGEFRRNSGDPVALGDVVGLSDERATPVYFEIRDRNVAVNPLQWIASSINLNP